jgi:hypothetical protein
MDTARACMILEICEPFNETDLRRSWYRSALKYHPDKNKDPESVKRFHEAKTAYEFLSMTKTNQERNHDYESLLGRFFEMCSTSGVEIAHIVGLSCQKVSLDAFKKLDKETAIRVFGYMEQYATLFQFDETLMSKLRAFVEADTEMVVIRPSIFNLLRSDVYCLNHNGVTYYIPMWHDELTYNGLVVKCIPDLPAHMLLDERNSLHLTVKTTISKVLSNRGLEITVGDAVLFIEGDRLNIAKHQRYVFENAGVSHINQKDAFDNSRRGKIVIHIELC